jgi:hypothetical protein
MNKQVELLAVQAGFNIHNDIIDGQNFNHEIQKFAELIIEECAKLAEYQGYNQAFGLGGLRTKLHEHFGVEE